MKPVTLTQIRNYLKQYGATLTKQKMRLNGLDAYKVQYSDGNYKILTVKRLKEAFEYGLL